MREKNLLGFYSFGLLFLFACFSLGYHIERYQTYHLLVAYSSVFISYLFLLQKRDKWEVLLILGILARVALFLSPPSLSDDVYRFIWDGTLLKNGIHPFAELPSFYLNHQIDGLSIELYEKLNSPNYFTIYPPSNQLLFLLSVQFEGGWLTTINILRLILLSAEIGSFFLLRELLQIFRKDQNLVFWYFLNPLVVLEVVGNLHFEGLVVFFILLGIFGYEKNKHWISSTGFGLAIGTKLLPVIYLPFLFFRGFKTRKWWVAILSGFIGILTLLPLLNETFINGMTSSLDLYFRKFEFNASIYFIAREIGFEMYGYNNIARIGPLLSIISFLSIISLSVVASVKHWVLPKAFLFILVIYILFGTVIHPWYIIPLIAFGLLSNYWFPILWSFMIFLTYTGYSETGFELPMWIVSLEYLTVLIFGLIEIKGNHRK